MLPALLLAVAMSAAATPMTVDEIVARHLEARGGAQKLAAVQNIKVSGKAFFGGDDFTSTAEFAQVRKRANQIRTEVTLQGLTRIDAYDGQQSWSVDPFQGRKDPFRTTADEARGLAQDADLDGALIGWPEKGNQVSYLGTEDVDGTPAHKLRIALKDGDVQYVYLDPDYFLEIRRVSERLVRGSERVTETDYGAYAQVNGVWFPTSVESGRKGAPKTQRFTLDSVEVNVPVEDGIFRFPAGPGARAIVPPKKPAPLLAQAPAPRSAAKAPAIDSGVISGLNARNIGSATMSGRISAVAGRNVGGKTLLFVGAASGGVWKSQDGGTTFKPVFDKQPVQSIGEVQIDPKNTQVIWVGTGESWTRNSVSIGDGIYKSIDGGESWTNMGLQKSERITQIAIDPRNPDTVYACAPGRLWSDSPDRGLYKTTDGGKTWDLILTGPNLSTGCSTVAMDPRNPDVLFAALWDFRRKGWTFRSGGNGATAASASALFKSTDGGRNWTEVKGLGPKPWGRVEVAIAPSNSSAVYAFVESTASALWRSSDGGNRWWKNNNLPVSQFYHVAIDDRDPYRVYGGLQDNSSWVAPTAYGGGISNAVWENLYGGDGFWTVPDPTDPEAVYAEAQGGYIGRVDRRLQIARDIQPKANYKERLRYNWNTPVCASPTQKATLYIGAQFLFRSRDRGDSWERISPDLTTNDPQKQKQEESGGVTVDNSSAEEHTTIYSISESRFDANTIWVGTDDGNVQLTRDGGKTWNNLVRNVKGLPPASWVSWVEASRHDAATAYAAFDRHTFGDMDPWVYRTTDFGKSWTRIVAPELGVRGYAHVVKEDLIRKDLLFVGTELGLWISIDGARSWAEFKGSDFPAVAVRDLQIHSRDGDLIIATHGRGIWIIDDLAPLRAFSQQTLAQEAAFLPWRATQQRIAGQGGWAEGDATFTGQNPATGAVISYYQRTRHLFGRIKLEVLHAQGNVVDTIPASKRRGIKRVSWTMQVKPPRVPRAAAVAFGGSQGPRVVPGTYTVRLTKGTQVYQTRLDIGLDRRAPWTVADRRP